MEFINHVSSITDDDISDLEDIKVLEIVNNSKLKGIKSLNELISSVAKDVNTTTSINYGKGENPGFVFLIKDCIRLFNHVKKKLNDENAEYFSKTYLPVIMNMYSRVIDDIGLEESLLLGVLPIDKIDKAANYIIYAVKNDQNNKYSFGFIYLGINFSRNSKKSSKVIPFINGKYPMILDQFEMNVKKYFTFQINDEILINIIENTKKSYLGRLYQDPFKKLSFNLAFDLKNTDIRIRVLD